MTVLHVNARLVGVQNQTVDNTYYLESDVSVSDADAADLETMVREYLERIYATLAAVQRTSIQATEFIVSAINLINGVETLLAGGAWTYAGTSSNEGLPPQSALRISFPALGYPRGKAVSIGGWIESQQQNGDWAAGALAAMINFGAEVLTAPPTTNGITLTPVGYRTAGRTVHTFTNTALITATVRPQATRAPGRGS